MAFEVPLFVEPKGEEGAKNPPPCGVARRDREGVVYVPETAPMLVRTENAVLAAEGAESAGFDRVPRRDHRTIFCCKAGHFHPNHTRVIKS